MSNIGLAQNLIKNKSITEVIALLEEQLCDSCKSKINNKLANDFIKEITNASPAQ